MPTTRTLAAALFPLAVSPMPDAAQAQDYPSRPLHWLVPFAPGGSGDALGRIMGQQLGERLGQPVIVENRPGANGIIAAQAVAKAPADGYSLLQAVDSTLTMPVSLPFKVGSDLAPVSLLVTQSRLLSSNPQKLPANNLQEFIAYARANPGKVNMGVGTGIGQLTAELFKSATGIDLVIVPFKGGNQSTPALLAGTTDLDMGEITSKLPHIKSGKLRALATTQSKRASALPEVPTLAELGYKFDAKSWFGLLTSGATPPAVVRRLNEETNRVLGGEAVKAKLTAYGMEPAPGTPEQLLELIASDSAQWARIVKQTGIRLQ
ncbi:MAG: tripartite tricarboxylate transporter substrate binding protein [Burkholderiales bacterium]|nr:tripartite tricarboxylate transporter substrate binding protein [Burkholderiales bacterium]